MRPLYRLTARKLSAMSLPQLQTHAAHLEYRASDPARPEEHTHSRQLADTRTEIQARGETFGEYLQRAPDEALSPSMREFRDAERKEQA